MKRKNLSKNGNEDDFFPNKKTVTEILLKFHLNTLLSASKSFDKAILTLSTATLGFTIIFVRYHIENHQAQENIGFLYFTWGFLIVSIFLMLISFWADQLHSRNEVSRYLGDYVEDKLCAKGIMVKAPILSGILFLFAIISFTFFVGYNL